MIIAGTGHRPDKIIIGFCDAYDQSVMTELVAFAKSCLQIERPELVISGMAQGWDTALALAATQLGIPFHAYVPFVGQAAVWPAAAQVLYKELLRQAKAVNFVSSGGYAAWKLQRRNEAMVDAADSVLALWDGSKGGTANCVNYAESYGKPVFNTWSLWQSWIKDIR